MFSGVGCWIHSLCSSCCRLICFLYVGVHHRFRRGFGIRSSVSMVFLSAVWMLRKCCDVVVFKLASVWVAIIVACSVGRIVCFCVLYLVMDRDGCMFFFCLGIGLWKMV